MKRSTGRLIKEPNQLVGAHRTKPKMKGWLAVAAKDGWMLRQLTAKKWKKV